MNRGFGLVKYILVGLLVCFIGVLLLSGGSSKASIGDVEQAVVKAAPMEGLEKADEKAFKKIYGLNANDYEGISLYIPDDVMSVNEILVIKVKNESQIETVEKAVESRVNTQEKNFEGYGVEQTKLIHAAIIETRGRYVLLAVSKDVDRIDAAFKKSI